MYYLGFLASMMNSSISIQDDPHVCLFCHEDTKTDLKYQVHAFSGMNTTYIQN